DVEADQKVVVVMGRPMEAVPRRVPLSLAVQLPVEIELGRALDAVRHRRGPRRAGVGREGAQALPRVEGPSRRRSVPERPARPAALRVRRLDQPVERLADPGVVPVPEPDQRPGHVAGVAVVTLSGREPADAASLQRGPVHPKLASRASRRGPRARASSSSSRGTSACRGSYRGPTSRPGPGARGSPRPTRAPECYSGRPGHRGRSPADGGARSAFGSARRAGPSRATMRSPRSSSGTALRTSYGPGTSRTANFPIPKRTSGGVPKRPLSKGRGRGSKPATLKVRSRRRGGRPGRRAPERGRRRRSPGAPPGVVGPNRPASPPAGRTPPPPPCAGPRAAGGSKAVFVGTRRVA